MDPSQRFSNRPLVLFPPFVLTHTMDVLHATKLNTDGERVADTDPTKTPLVRYKCAVTDAMKALHASPSRRSSWKSLRMLGRPLWLKLDESVQEDKEGLVQVAAEKGLVQVAAEKILCGKLPDAQESFSGETLNGVAAVLCRVGIRPYSSSPMAAGIVADFMAVLSYVGHMHDQFVSSYSSDPILTLGATCVWHSLGQSMLAQRMLPQLRKLLHQEVMDTGNVGEMVARIVLLLAMDACAVIDGDQSSLHWSGAGEFYSVWTFLTALQGDSPTLRVAKKVTKAATAASPSGASASASASASVSAINMQHPTPLISGDRRKSQRLESKAGKTSLSSSSADMQQRANAQPVQAQKITSSMLIDADKTATETALKAVESHWKDWFVSFTHFVQLAEVPSEACLWAMLGRRAAGIMPRGQKAVDLVIPICTSGPSGGDFAEANARVSMIFVQVKNMERADSTFPGSATVKMRPCEVFMKQTKKKEPEDSEEKIKKKAEDSEQKIEDPGKKPNAASAATEKKPKALSPAQKAKLEKEQQKKEEKAKFAALGPESVLRIYMSLRSKKEERFYLEDTVDGATLHVLCLKGLASLSVHRKKGDENASGETGAVPVLTQGVVDELKKLLPPWWKVRTLVEEDITCRDNKATVQSSDKDAGVASGQRFGMPKETLVQCALNPLAETVLLNSDDAETIPLTNSRLGRKVPTTNDPPSSAPPTESYLKRSREGTIVSDGSKTSSDTIAAQSKKAKKATK